MNRWRRRVAIAFGTLVLLWPIAQMTLVHARGVNPWKLSGWGMYASEAPQDVQIRVIFVEHDAPPLREIELPPLGKDRFAAIIYRQQGTQTLDTKQMFNKPVVRSVRLTQVLHRDGDVARLVAQLTDRLPPEAVPDYALVLTSEQRFNVFGRYAYTTSTAYEVADEQVRKLGHFSTNEQSLPDMLDAIEHVKRGER